ncbi:MAG: hypothetical protein H7A46_26600 [Verrucomicrobiales bacterium]|nr:hypothetical protein [Verrucomicrobiales bacterium]
MKPPSPVLEALASRYERSQAGRTGSATRDVLVSLEELLADAGCREGAARAVAEMELQDAETAGLLRREPVHPRDPSHIGRIRFSPGSEAALYAAIHRDSPSERRRRLADQFAGAGSVAVPDPWKEPWRCWCDRMRSAALAGDTVAPFDREATEANRSLLELLPKLLAWEGESLVRFASCVLCGDSKRLETLAAMERAGEFAGQLRGKLGKLLEDITAGQLRALDDLGIVPNPRFALAHGPLRLRFGGDWLDCGLLQGAFRLAERDLCRADELRTAARRCVTVENETSFHELAKLGSGELLVQTSYPGSGTLALLRRLPAEVEFHHFGDSDAAGFDILRVLRAKTGRDIRPLHMTPGRVPAEQESLGRPTSSRWPFWA